MTLEKTTAKTNIQLPTWRNVQGVDTIHVEKNDTPLVTLTLSFPVGSYADPPGKSGLASFACEMMLRGTQKHPREDFENELDHLGATLSMQTGHHSTQLLGRVLKRNAGALVKLMLEVLTEPTFVQSEIDKLRKVYISRLYLQLENDASLAKSHFRQNLFVDHPYGNRIDGNIDSLKTLTRDEITRFHKAHIHQDGLLVGSAGGIDQHTFDTLTRAMLAQLPNGKNIEKTLPFKRSFGARNIILIDKPDRSQTQFLIGHPGIDINHQDYLALQIFLGAFGGHMFQAQLMQEIRVKRGWAYGASANLDALRDGGSFFMSTYPAVKDTLPAIRLILELLANAVSKDGLTDEKLEFAKTYLKRSFPFLIDTPEEILSRRIRNRLYNRPRNYLETYIEKIDTVTPEMAREAAKRHLDPKNVLIVVLCTAKDFKDTLRSDLDATSLKIVPYDKL